MNEHQVYTAVLAQRFYHGASLQEAQSAARNMQVSFAACVRRFLALGVPRPEAELLAEDIINPLRKD